MKKRGGCWRCVLSYHQRQLHSIALTKYLNSLKKLTTQMHELNGNEITSLKKEEHRTSRTQVAREVIEF